MIGSDHARRCILWSRSSVFFCFHTLNFRCFHLFCIPLRNHSISRPNLAQQKELMASDIKINEDTAVFATVLGKYTHPDNLDRALKGIVQWSDPKAVPKKKRKTKKQILAMGEASSVTVKKPVQTSSTIKISSLERRMKAIPRQHRAALRAYPKS